MENLQEELNLLGAQRLAKLKTRIVKPQIPDDYFETLHDRVIDRLREETDRAKQQPALLSVTHGGRWRKWAAAAVFVSIAATTWWQLQQQPSNKTITLADLEIDNTDYEAYLLDMEVPAYEEMEAPNTTQDPISVNSQAKETQRHFAPSNTELDLLEDLTDEDLEELL